MVGLVSRLTESLSAGRQGPCWPVFKKIACLMAQLGSGPCFAGRIGSGVRVSAIFQKNVHLVGRLGSETRLVADRSGVVPANMVD